MRVYDLLFGYDVLLDTDGFIRRPMKNPKLQREMTTWEFHYRIGRYVAGREKKTEVAADADLVRACPAKAADIEEAVSSGRSLTGKKMQMHL
jgi:deoxyhypusine synthase